jgi:Zn finger protein HypA/HybF involved in hydrogenase expression
MHEHTFIEAIVRNIKDREKVKGITLEVGELVGIEAEHLKEHLQEKFDWDIKVLKKDALVKCDCGFEGRPKILERLHDLVIFECPECAEVPEILKGKDIKILKIIYN